MEKFEELSQEKQRRIIDAGMEVFGRYEYKRQTQRILRSRQAYPRGYYSIISRIKKLLYVSVSVLCNYHHKDAG